MNKLKVHWILLRPFAAAGVLVSMLLGFLLAGANDITTFIIAFIGSAFILFGVHYHNSLSDFLKGIDRGETAKAYTAASEILPKGYATVMEVLLGTLILYAAGIVVWTWIAITTTPLALIPPLIGMGCGVAYNTFGKYKGLGEVLLALAFGLASTLAGYVPVARTITLTPVLAALIPGILFGLFYTIDQWQDKDRDSKLGIVNIAIILSRRNFPISRYLEFGFFVALIVHLYLILLGILPAMTFLSIAATPLMFLAVLTADTDPRLSSVYTLLVFGFYVVLMDIGLVF